MMSFGFWFAAGVCLFMVSMYIAYKVGKSLAKAIKIAIGIIIGVWLISSIFEFLQVMIIFISIGLLFILIGYSIYKAFKQVIHFKEYDIGYHILLLFCIIITIMGGYKISFILYGGISILLDLGIISKKYKGNE